MLFEQVLSFLYKAFSRGSYPFLYKAFERKHHKAVLRLCVLRLFAGIPIFSRLSKGISLLFKA